MGGSSGDVLHRNQVNPLLAILLTLGAKLVLIWYETLQIHRRYRWNMRLRCSFIFKRGDNPGGNSAKHKNDESDLRKRSSG